jgi:hypothetical protein
MVFRRFFFVVFILLFCAPQKAEAECMTLDRETTPGSFETIYLCKNTISKPAYTIFQHYVGENSILVFNFDPFGANIVCTDYEFAGTKMAECRKAGIRRIKPNYAFKKKGVATKRLSKITEAERKELFEGSTAFSYPKSFNDIESEQCFVHVAKGYQITLGYDDSNYMALSTCLIQLEIFFKSNKKFLLKLLRQ